MDLHLGVILYYTLTNVRFDEGSMSSCKKCRAGPMSVHVLPSGLCQACQSEIEWKRGPHIVRQQKIQKAK